MNHLAKELKRHLARLALISVASIGMGFEALLGLTGEWNKGFGTLTVGWAAVNLIICLVSALGKPPADLQKFREFLFLNEGLNVAYIGVGTTMAILGNPWVEGAGVAVAIQGFILFVLDAWLLKKTPRAIAPEPHPESPDTAPTDNP